jgi:hypothetical protein
MDLSAQSASNRRVTNAQWRYWRIKVRNILFVFIAVAFLLGGIAFTQQPDAAKKDGWWINASIQKQNPQMMVFYVGSGSGSYGFWKVWNPGDPVEFDIPDEYRNVPKLYIKAQTTSGLKCRFCVMFKTKGTRHFEYDLEEDHEMKQSDEDKLCR